MTIWNQSVVFEHLNICVPPSSLIQCLLLYVSPGQLLELLDTIRYNEINIVQ